MSESPRAEDSRTAEPPIEPFFIRRRSPRATSEPLGEAKRLTIFEAWAPSTYNEQAWRFPYALRETPQGPLLFDRLMEANEKEDTALKVPEEYAVAAIFARGCPADPAALPDQMCEREVPGGRRPVRESICEGVFAFTEAKA